MLNERIRALRKMMNMSQVELARRLGVKKQSVCNWENDNIQPSVEMLKKLASVLAVSADDLLEIKPDETLNVTGLSEEEKAHLRLLIEDLRGR